MKIEKKSDDDHQLASLMPAPSLVSPPPSMGQINAIMGLLELLHRLTGDQFSCCRQIIPIVGMGGIGKTTLAAKAYEHPLVKRIVLIVVFGLQISQNCVIRQILVEIICQQCQMSKDDLKDESEGEIGEIIHKSFSGRRYLVVMDDMWNIEALKMISRYLPDDGNRSRIVITTRLSNMADVAAPSSSIHMDFLDEEKSWDLFCTTVFRGAACPLELEDLGKSIARNCKGLPLSIVVIGGFLLKSFKCSKLFVQ